MKNKKIVNLKVSHSEKDITNYKKKLQVSRFYADVPNSLILRYSMQNIINAYSSILTFIIHGGLHF